MSTIKNCPEEVKISRTFEELNSNDLIAMLANIFELIVDSNEGSLISINKVFDAPSPPKILIKDYIERIFKYSKTENEILIIALCYVDRILAKNPEFILTTFNVHRFFYNKKDLFLFQWCFLLSF